MSKQDINIVKEFNTWRQGGLVEFGNEGYPKRLSEALDSVVEMADQYEKLTDVISAWVHARNAKPTGMFGLAERDALIKAEDALQAAWNAKSGNE